MAGVKMDRDVFIKAMLASFMNQTRNTLEASKLADHMWTKYEIAFELKPRRIVEIGVRAGYSAWSMIQGAEPESYFGIDLYGDNDAASLWMPAFYRTAHKLLSGLKTPFVIIRHDSHRLAGVPTSDFYHVDGDHSEDGAYMDLMLCWRSLPDEGYILCDDYDFMSDVRRAVDRFCDERHTLLTTRYIKSYRGEFLIRKNKGVGVSWPPQAVVV